MKKLMKKYPGSRFKMFPKQMDAVVFACSFPDVQSVASPKPAAILPKVLQNPDFTLHTFPIVYLFINEIGIHTLKNKIVSSAA